MVIILLYYAKIEVVRHVLLYFGVKGVDYGEDIQIEGSQVTVHFHLTSPLCPSKFATSIGQEIRKRVETIPGVTSCEVLLRDHFLRDKIQERINARGTR